MRSARVGLMPLTISALNSGEHVQKKYLSASQEERMMNVICSNQGAI
jgi:hypothetical protein